MEAGLQDVGEAAAGDYGPAEPPISLLSQYQARPKFLVFAIRPIMGGVIYTPSAVYSSLKTARSVDFSRCCRWQLTIRPEKPFLQAERRFSRAHFHHPG